MGPTHYRLALGSVFLSRFITCLPLLSGVAQKKSCIGKFMQEVWWSEYEKLRGKKEIKTIEQSIFWCPREENFAWIIVQHFSAEQNLVYEMVFFTCDACGASLKKNQVEKHYLHQCRRCSVLTCIDCQKVAPWLSSYSSNYPFCDHRFHQCKDKPFPCWKIVL